MENVEALEPRKWISVRDVVKNHGDEISNLYEKELLSIKDLAIRYGVSNNSMMIIIGVLGYPHEKWSEQQVINHKNWFREQKENRVKSQDV